MASDAVHVVIILSPFLLLPVAGWLGARGAHRASLLAIVPAALTAYFLRVWWIVASAGAFQVTLPWAPRLGLSLSFRFDGLSALFATLITGIGTLIVLYAAEYLKTHPHAGRFQVSLFAFMGSMLGVVLSDNVIVLFVFWELTGFTSYLLIGFEHERPRRAARRTPGVARDRRRRPGAPGGRHPALTRSRHAEPVGVARERVDVHRRSALRRHRRLVLLAAFTKSAQFPFHFWLPNAMQAPTPVSAYLHSATMVKAGVYLVARMTPFLGGTTLWIGAITIVGALTMMVGAGACAVRNRPEARPRVLDRQRARDPDAAARYRHPGRGHRRVVYLLAHACYKGALFLVAGAVEHETGTRDVRRSVGCAARCRGRRSPPDWPPHRWPGCRCSSGSSPRSSSTRVSGGSVSRAWGADGSRSPRWPRASCSAPPA